MALPSFGFFVTVGRGTETFAESEIRNKFSTQRDSLLDLRLHDGKIVFQLSGIMLESFVEQILTLRCVERAFVTITEYVNDANGKRDFLNQLMGRMATARNYEAVKKVLDQLSSLFHQKKLMSEQSHNLSCNEEPPRKVARMQNSSSSNTPCTELQSHDCLDMAKANEIEDLNEDNLNKTVFETFRMCVKCSGKSSKWINLRKLSKDVSWRISRTTNWIVDLRRQDFEICLHVNDHHIFAGIPLTRKPLSRRPFILDPGLRAPVAWIMVQLAQIQAGDVILDPMCGKGTLLLEACSCIKNIFCVGGDMDTSQLTVALQNIKSVGFDKKIDLLQVDSLCLPFKSRSVDVIVCDAPFNQKYFTSKKADEFYTSFLQEMYRVVKKDGRFVLLTSCELSKMIVSWLQTDIQLPHSLTESSAPLSQKSENNDTSESEVILLTESSDCHHSPVTQKFLFKFVAKHYMKLGETHADILVMTKL